MSDNLTTNTNSNGVTFKPYGNLLSSTSPNLNQQIDTTSLSLGMMRMNSSSNNTNTNQYLNKSNDMIDANRRLLMQQNGGSNFNGISNNNQLQLFSSNGYQSQRTALSSSSNSSIQQSNDVHKENQEM